MKQQDFDRLKAICEKDGYECFEPSNIQDDPIFLIRKKKDIWEGVEYAESLYDSGVESKQFTKGKIYKIDWIDIETLRVVIDDQGYKNGMNKNSFKPSTESAYIDQLKKEAFERVGNLSRQETDFTGIHGGFIAPNEEWIYRKDTDTLYWHGAPIYQSGKWASRVSKRIEVEFDRPNSGMVANHYFHTIEYTFNIKRTGKYYPNPIEAGQFLASQLEKYLNGEIE